jgi:hypothetical protein
MNSSAVIKHSEMTEEMQVEVIDVARLGKYIHILIFFACIVLLFVKYYCF